MAVCKYPPSSSAWKPIYARLIIADEPLASPPPIFSTSFPPSEQDGTPTDEGPHSALREQITWWNYRSWATTKAGSGSNPDPGDLDEPGAGASSPPPTSPSPLPPLVSFPLTDAQPTMPIAVVGLSLLNNIQTTSEPESRDISTKSDGTNATQSTNKYSEGAWYAHVPVPWTWGSTGPSPTPADPSGSGPGEGSAGPPSDSVEVQTTGADGDPESDSPQKEEAPLKTVDPPPSEEPNPLTTSFHKDTLTWASFLRTSRRILSVKRVTDGTPTDNGVKRDENGVEVMDVDFEEEGVVDAKPEGGGKVALPLLFVSGGDSEEKKVKNGGPNTQNGGRSPAFGSPSGAAGLASRIWTSTTTTSTMTMTTTTNQPSRSPTPSRPASRMAVDSQTPQATPSRAPTPSQRHASPAPSKRSISSKSKPPNVVLPKWEETFLSAPRSVVSAGYRARAGMGVGVSEGERVMLGRGVGGDEGIGGKILGRTVKFVSGLLGAGATGAGTEAKDAGMRGAEDTTSDIEKRLGSFGQELPKAWKVLEGVAAPGLEADVLRGCKKVVVIGVHGWFPGTIVRTMLGEVRLALFIFFFI